LLSVGALARGYVGVCLVSYSVMVAALYRFRYFFWMGMV